MNSKAYCVERAEINTYNRHCVDVVVRSFDDDRKR